MAARTFSPLDQEARIARAFQQAGDYVLVQRGDEWLCEGPRGSYIVTATSCTCDDWRYRCSNAGAVCKHMYLLTRMLLELGGEPVPAIRPEDEQWPCDGCGALVPAGTLTKCPVTGAFFCRTCQEAPREEGVCQRCGVVEPVEALVAIDDVGGYACCECYERRPEERAPSRKPMTPSEEAAFARIFG